MLGVLAKTCLRQKNNIQNKPGNKKGRVMTQPALAHAGATFVTLQPLNVLLDQRKPAM
jgi:hypothetical protein